MHVLVLAYAPIDLELRAMFIGDLLVCLDVRLLRERVRHDAVHPKVQALLDALIAPFDRRRKAKPSPLVLAILLEVHVILELR